MDLRFGVWKNLKIPIWIFWGGSFVLFPQFASSKPFWHHKHHHSETPSPVPVASVATNAAASTNISTVAEHSTIALEKNPPNPGLNPSLLAAAEAGDTPLVQKLLARGAVVDATDGDGYTALIWACAASRVDMVQTLLVQGADVNLQATSDGKTALMFGAMKGSVEIVQLLIARHADLNTKDRDGSTALIWGVCAGQSGTVQLLIDQGADPFLKDKEGRTALMWARLGQHVSCIKLLERTGHRAS